MLVSAVENLTSPRLFTLFMIAARSGVEAADPTDADSGSAAAILADDETRINARKLTRRTYLIRSEFS